jgi:hypothetical protein
MKVRLAKTLLFLPNPTETASKTPVITLIRPKITASRRKSHKLKQHKFHETYLSKILRKKNPSPDLNKTPNG